MFELGFTTKDLVRVLWAGVFAAAALLATGVTDWKVLAGAAVAGGLSAIKNGVLADGSVIKG